MKNISTLSPKDAKHQISPLIFYLSLLFAESQNRLNRKIALSFQSPQSLLLKPHIFFNRKELKFLRKVRKENPINI